MKTKKYKVFGYQTIKREVIVEIEVLENDTENDLWEKAFAQANEYNPKDTKIIEEYNFIDWDDLEDA